jgi:hypothetical protein
MNPFPRGFSQFNGAPKPFGIGAGGGGPRPFALPFSQALRPPQMSGSRGLFGGYQQQLNALPRQNGPGFMDRLGTFADQMGGGAEQPIEQNPVQFAPMMQAPQLQASQGPGGNVQGLLEALYMQGRR